jgi:putative CocE/NonD family hydrolase
LDLVLGLTISCSIDARRRASTRWGPKTLGEAKDHYTERDRRKWLWYLPLMEMPDEVIFGMGRHFRRWLEDHATDHFRFLEKHRQVNVPALVSTGWYDQHVQAIKHFTGMTENGMTDHARRNQRLIVGPWKHTSEQWDSKVGEVDFGPEAHRDYYQTADDWFSHWLKGESNGVEEWPLIQLFVMGANRWRDESEWPLARTRYTDFYFHGGGHANTSAGDGILSQAPPLEEPADQYVYDPRDPVMTAFSPSGLNEPSDLRTLDGRHDVLVYATPPLEEPLEVTGPVTVKLWAASTARDTDFTAKLVDIWPDGFAQELCYGIVRARYRDSFDQPSLIRPGESYEYTIQLNPTSNLFRAGHRVRVDISSSDFPNFDRNHNTGGDDYAEATLLSAAQSIYHNHSRPSRVILPVIP